MPGEPDLIRPILQYSVLCDAIGQGPNNKLVFLGVFSLFTKPSTIAQMFIVNAWTFGKGGFKETARILTPDLHVMVNLPEVEFMLKDQALSHVNVTGVGGLNFDRIGTYWVEIYLNETRVLSYPLPVLQT